MSKLSEDTNVDPAKVFPQNLRHLFVLSYYQLEKDVIRLTDIFGHSSVETTRIYTITSTSEIQRLMSKLDLLDN